MYGCSRKREIFSDLGECHRLLITTSVGDILQYCENLAHHRNVILVGLLRLWSWLCAFGHFFESISDVSSYHTPLVIVSGQGCGRDLYPECGRISIQSVDCLRCAL